MCITRDNVSIEVDAVVYWQLLEHSQAYYAVDNLQAAMVNLVLTQIRAEMGKLDLDQTFTTRSEVNELLLKNSMRPRTLGCEGDAGGDARYQSFARCEAGDGGSDDCGT